MATNQTAEERILTIPEVAERLRLSRDTVYRKVAGGQLPALQLGQGGPLRVSERALTGWLAAQTTTTAEENIMTREEFNAYARAAIAEQRAFAAKHGDYLNAARTREARRRETVTHLPKIGDELIRKKRRLEHVVRRHHWRQGPAFSVPLEAQLSDGRRVRWQYWPHSGRAEILEPAS